VNPLEASPHDGDSDGEADHLCVVSAVGDGDVYTGGCLRSERGGCGETDETENEAANEDMRADLHHETSSKQRFTVVTHSSGA
jgi:hypothetical protein